MITKEEIESIGWRQVSVSANGGSLGFQRGKSLFKLTYHGNNFIYKREDNPKLNSIQIDKIDLSSRKFISIYDGTPKNIDELIAIIRNLEIL